MFEEKKFSVTPWGKLAEKGQYILLKNRNCISFHCFLMEAETERKVDFLNVYASSKFYL